MSTQTNQVITLRPTYIHQWMTCPKKLAYTMAGVKPRFQSVNLIFGQLIHEAIEHYLKGFLLADELAFWFEHTWRETIAKCVVEYPKSKSPAVFEAIGIQLLQKFPAYWDSLGLEPLFVELPLKMDIGNNVHLGMTIDFVGRATRDHIDPEGNIVFRKGDTVIIDWKTQAAEEPAGFGMQSFQFAYYWLALNLHSARLATPSPSACGYAVGIKPNIQDPKSKSLAKTNWEPVMYSTRATRIQREAIRVAHACADQIRHNQLYRQPGMAFNTPCDSSMGNCDFVAPCIYGEEGNLKYPDHVDFIKLVA